MMESNDSQALYEAKTLARALPYMRQYHGETFVIKIGGAAMKEGAPLETFAKDVSLLRHVGIDPVVVHGGGVQIGEMLARLKIKSEFVDGLRITDQETAEIVEMVLSGVINKRIVTAIEKAGGLAVGISGKDGAMMKAQALKHKVKEPSSNIEKFLDLGFVGEPTTINVKILDLLKAAHIIPVISPLAPSIEGVTYNINADVMAGALASRLGAVRFLLLTDVDGVLDKKGKLIERLSLKQAQELIKDNTITGGMLPKVKTCIKALQEGAQGAVIVNGLTQHAILLETFTHHGAGTLITP